MNANDPLQSGLRDVKDESFSIMNGALDEKISSELGLLWLASLSARWKNLSVGTIQKSKGSTECVF